MKFNMIHWAGNLYRQADLLHGPVLVMVPSFTEVLGLSYPGEYWTGHETKITQAHRKTCICGYAYYIRPPEAGYA